MAALFLPFTPRGKDIEIKAIGIKRSNGYGDYDAVDPAVLAGRMGVMLVADTWFGSLDPGLRDKLLVDIARCWSAASLQAGGTTYVLLNPTHSPERHSPSLAEELVHVALGHPKSQILRLDGVPVRTCQHEVESEAYAVAAALLMPYRTMFNHLQAGGGVDAIPALVPVSAECRAYRVKIAGLWKMARARGLLATSAT